MLGSELLQLLEDFLKGLRLLSVDGGGFVAVGGVPSRVLD